MIHYALVCERGHQFESWFQDSAAYDRQVKRGLVSCPQCSSSKVEKAIMAPRLSVTAKKQPAPIQPPGSAAEAPANPAPSAPVSSAPCSWTPRTDNVGAKFPEEARKMHNGEIEHRSIYGVASSDEAKELSEEGIEFHPLPVLPDERN